MEQSYLLQKSAQSKDLKEILKNVPLLQIAPASSRLPPLPVSREIIPPSKGGRFFYARRA